MSILSAITNPVATVIGGGLQLFGSLFGANEQANAADKAAQLQSKTSADQLAFLRQQAGADARNNATTQLANYDLSNARTRRLNSLGGILGLPGQDMPAPPKLLQDEASGAYNPYGDNTLGSVMGAPNGGGPSPASASPASAGMVTLRAPTGQVTQVPSAQAAYYIARGAKQVS